MQARHTVAEMALTLGNCDLRYMRPGTGPPVVLVHPLRTQREYFLPVIRALGLGSTSSRLTCPGMGWRWLLRKNPRVTQAIAINPYDYGRWSGIRSSPCRAIPPRTLRPRRVPCRLRV
jgi:hypothetical protein